MKVPSYSIAKTFTVAALIEAGVDLNSRVGDFLSLHDRYASRSVKALMQHVSGLPDYHALSEYRSSVADRKKAWSTDEMLERAMPLPDVEIGRFSYSNIGFCLLRMILEKVTYKDFFDALNEKVFAPLGIHDVAPINSLHDWNECAGADESVKSYDPNWVYPRMVLATPDAMARTFEGIFSGQLFDPKMMLEPVAVDAPNHTFANPSYGLGVMIDGPRWVGHGGGGAGFTLFALSTPDGSRAHVAYSVGEDYGDAALIKECLAHLER